jgi:hypothetical protein
MTLYILSDCLNYGYLRIKQFLEENPNAILYGTTGLALVMLTLEISVFFVPEPRISHCHRHRTGTARRQESKDDDDDGGGDDDENNDDSGNEYVTGDEQDELHEEDCRSFSPQALIKEETPSDVEQINFESQKYYENYAKYYAYLHCFTNIFLVCSLIWIQESPPFTPLQDGDLQ